ncbi:MAG TPA: hypothetical protein ENK75_04560 [Saprospiraceae bacterium]|nr:hypothetical protein [Saprospiraceae bacterium]
MNNFQKLQQEQEKKYELSGAPHKKKVKGTLSSFKFIASIIEVYLPKVGDLLIAFAGGTHSESKKQSPSSPPNIEDRERRR